MTIIADSYTPNKIKTTGVRCCNRVVSDVRGSLVCYITAGFGIFNCFCAN